MGMKHLTVRLLENLEDDGKDMPNSKMCFITVSFLLDVLALNWTGHKVK